MKVAMPINSETKFLHLRKEVLPPPGVGTFFIQSILKYTVLLVTATLLLIMSSAVLGQSTEPDFMESFKESFDHQPKPTFRYETRNSFISTRSARISGIKIGLDFNKTVQVGLGYNWLSSDLFQERSIASGLDAPFTTDFKLRFRYFSPYIDYTFYRKKRWEISIPVQLGMGTARYEYANSAGIKEFTKGKFILLYEPQMVAQYKLMQYFAVGGGVGFRLILAGNNAMPENFNSPTYVIKAKVYFADIYNDFLAR